MSDSALIFGAQGQLGHALVTTLSAQGHEVIGLDRAACDVEDPEAVEAALATHQPARVFNATAYNAVDRAEDEPDIALRLNSLVPGQLAAACRRHDAALMHFSTDYVFGHGHVRPIDESQTPAPLSVYGRSKLLGEQLALANHRRVWVVRCCGLYGERRHNFVRTMIRLALAGRPLKVVSDQLVSPTWVAPLAQVSAALSETQVYGTFHAVAHGQASWHAYASLIFEALELEADLTPVHQEDWAAPAERPAYSVLDNALLRLLELDTFAPWDEALRAFLAQHGPAILADERAKLRG